MPNTDNVIIYIYVVIDDNDLYHNTITHPRCTADG